MGIPYTKKEDAAIKRAVRNSPTNIKQGLEKVAEKLGRSYRSVAQRYYKYLQKEPTNNLFFIFSIKKRAKNYKVTRRGRTAVKYTPENNNQSKWKRILDILFEK